MRRTSRVCGSSTSAATSEVLRLRRSAGATFYFAGEKAVTDPETLDAMQRQVNNCALAKEVDRAIKDAQAK